MRLYRSRHDEQRQRPFFWDIILILLVAVSAYFLGSFLPISPPSLSSQPLQSYPIRLGEEKLIDPLLYVASENQKSSALSSLQAAMNNQITSEVKAHLASDVAIYVRELKSDNWTGVNEGEKFAPASLLKVPILIAYLKAAESNSRILTDQLAYTGEDANDTEDIKPLKEIEKDKQYTVNDLLSFMIKYSDNNATLLLINHLGADAIDNVYADLQVQNPTSTFSGDFLSPQDYSIFFRVLYSATYLNRDDSERALELLTYPDFPQGIEAGVPAGVPVAQKFGERSMASADPNSSKELHDCGIVYNPDNPYFVCIMTKGDDFIKLENVIRDLSVTVWRGLL